MFARTLLLAIFWPVVLSSQPISLDRLYSLPRIIGTEPTGLSWSADGEKLAFLWNDHGENFHDLFLVTVDVAIPQRLTMLSVPPDQNHPGIVAMAWHPSGEKLVFELDGKLYLFTIGSYPQELTKRSGYRNATFANNGKWLAYLRDGALWVAELEAETLVRQRELANNPRPEVMVQSYKWSPDSRHLAFIETDFTRVPIKGIPDYLADETTIVPVRRPFPGEEPAARRIAVVDIEEGNIVWLDLTTSATDPIFSYRWSSRGEILADLADLYVKDRRILSINPNVGTVMEWYREANPTNVTAYWQADWATDGKTIYFLSDRDEDYHLYHLSKPNGKPVRITEGPFAVSEFTISNQTDSIYFVANAPRAEERHLFRTSLVGGEPVQLSTKAGTHKSVISPNGAWAADLFSSDQMPPELFLLKLSEPQGSSNVKALNHDLETGLRARRITSSPLPEFYQQEWVKPHYVTFESQTDGATIHGRMMLPLEFNKQRKYPVIIGSIYSNSVRNQWGGRNVHPLWGLDQYLLGRGFILFVLDIRGSWGHGKSFRQGIRLDYGGIDVEDIYSGVLYLKSLDYVDGKRIGIWGSSYGGLLTCMSLFKRPGVFKAGVAGAPATNLFHALTEEMRVMSSPQDEHETYIRSSAYVHAEKLADKLLIIHGMQDRIVLYKDSVALVEKLQRLGKDVDFVTLPDAGHGWDREELHKTRFAFKKLVQHFERHLTKRR